MLDLEARAALAYPGTIGAGGCAGALLFHVMLVQPAAPDLFTAAACVMGTLSGVLVHIGTKARIDLEVERQRRR